MDERTMQRIGIMGGTFDPIHYGHLMIAENAREQFGLEKVLFIPTGHSPHKQEQDVTSPFHRCQMVSLAIEDNSSFLLDRIEVDSPDISYTYLTLEKIREYYKNTELFFILGADSLFDFESWKEPEDILKNCSVLAAYRNHQKQEKFFQRIAFLNQKYQEKFFPLNTPNLEVSSQDIRNRLQDGRTIRYLVPRKVEEYIRTYHLYEGEGSEDETGRNRKEIEKGIR